MNWLSSFALQGMTILSTLFLFALGLVVLALIFIFIIDVNQTADAVRRNYPVIGRFRYLFSTLGEFFR